MNSASRPSKRLLTTAKNAVRRACATKTILLPLPRVLGVGSLEFWKHPDGGLAALGGLAAQLKDLLQRERPDVVYLPFAADAHPDHKALAAAFSKAAGRGKIPALECRYEIWSMLEPGGVADITGLFEVKLEALRQYRSQLRYYDFLGRISRLSAARALFLPRSR